LSFSFDLTEFVNVSDSLYFFPLGISKVWLSLDLLEFSLGLLKDLFNTFLEEFNLDFWNVKHFDVFENFLAGETVNDDCH